eukprot:8300767-Heterocapsa_arctica.AAC.1
MFISNAQPGIREAVPLLLACLRLLATEQQTHKRLSMKCAMWLKQTASDLGRGHDNSHLHTSIIVCTSQHCFLPETPTTFR